MSAPDTAQTAAILALAEAKCLSTSHDLVPEVEPLPTGKVLHGPFEVDCEVCDGTGRRFPSLSRACPAHAVYDEGERIEVTYRDTGPMSHPPPVCDADRRLPIAWRDEYTIRLALRSNGYRVEHKQPIIGPAVWEISAPHRDTCTDPVLAVAAQQAVEAEEEARHDE
jgi:hypothetical protein